jgi:hypothetical protein
LRAALRPSRRVALVLAALALAALAARVAAPSHATQTRAPHSLVCGVERWAVKTLQDRPHLLGPRASNVAHLIGIPRPAHVPSTRLSSERRVYSVIASATMIREEADQDLHIVLQKGTKHLIAEAPNAPFCTANATAYRKKQMRKARSLVRPFCAKARVVGVAFWDYYHGQTGVAPNVIELHPILGYSCLGGGGPPPPPPPGPPPPPPPGGNCAPSYPDECIRPPPPDLNCGDIPYRNFRVLWNVADPDPHHFDGDRDGIGCET